MCWAQFVVRTLAAFSRVPLDVVDFHLWVGSAHPPPHMWVRTKVPEICLGEEHEEPRCAPFLFSTACSLRVAMRSCRVSGLSYFSGLGPTCLFVLLGSLSCLCFSGCMAILNLRQRDDPRLIVPVEKEGTYTETRSDSPYSRRYNDLCRQACVAYLSCYPQHAPQSERVWDSTKEPQRHPPLYPQPIRCLT